MSVCPLCYVFGVNQISTSLPGGCRGSGDGVGYPPSVGRSIAAPSCQHREVSLSKTLTPKWLPSRKSRHRRRQRCARGPPNRGAFWPLKERKCNISHVHLPHRTKPETNRRPLLKKLLWIITLGSDTVCEATCSWGLLLADTFSSHWCQVANSTHRQCNEGADLKKTNPKQQNSRRGGTELGLRVVCAEIFNHDV